MKLPYKSLGPLKSTFQILVRPLYLVKRSPAKAKTKDSYFTLSLRPVVHNLHWHRLEMLQKGQFLSAIWYRIRIIIVMENTYLDVIHLFSISTKNVPTDVPFLVALIWVLGNWFACSPPNIKVIKSNDVFSLLFIWWLLHSWRASEYQNLSFEI